MSSTKKHLINLPGPHFVVYESTLPTPRVLARLDKVLNREKATGILQTVTQDLKSQQEFEEKIESVTSGGGDIMYMGSIPLHSLTAFRTQNPTQPLILNYQLGNPLYAQRILKLNPLAAANIPPRLVVAENESTGGTTVALNLWSSVMRDPFSQEAEEGEEEGELTRELRVLDEKFDKLVLGVLDADVED